MKKISIALLLCVLYVAPVKADEGMWLPMLLHKNMEEMRAKGLQLSMEELYSINQPSLKDAIVSFSGYCTGEIISGQGLILTNHHCGYDAIQSLSTDQDNILKHGFWAMAFEEERPAEGLYVEFLDRMDDVTSDILKGITDNTSEKERARIIAERIAEMQGATTSASQRIEVKPFFKGNEYYMFTYKRYDDIRLVGTPPESIGKFGGDTDNWMWPRQTGDFSMFRVYANADGEPAPYSPENTPLVPKHHLPVSTSGVELGDFTMIWGYPGSTDRYLSSYGVNNAIDINNPTVVDIRTEKLRVMDSYMNTNESVKLKYASKRANVSNYWKYFIGQTKGLKALDVVGSKQAQEKSFMDWLRNDQHKLSRYNDAMQLIKSGHEAEREYILPEVYARESALTGPDVTLFGLRTIMTLERGYWNPNLPKEAKEGILASLKQQAADHFKDYHQPLDRDLLVQLFNKHHRAVNSAEDKPEFYKLLDKKYKGDAARFAKKAYKKSMFVDFERCMEFLENPDSNALKKDAFYQPIKDIYAFYSDYGMSEEERASLEKGYRLYIDGMRKMNPDKLYYPDANFTLRCTYGEVQDYAPRDGVKYKHFTTLEGILQKKNNDDPEFIVPEKLEKLIRDKSYGQYADEDGSLHVCFISNNDITGGNSGSPVINGKGELVGCAFDGNWEAMSGDIAFAHDIQQTISVDIRYVLFVVDQFAGCTRLIEEMDIVAN